jgi:hypothetical protein
MTRSPTRNTPALQRRPSHKSPWVQSSDMRARKGIQFRRERNLGTTVRPKVSLAAMRWAGEYGFVLLAHGGNVFENSVTDMHFVVDVNEIHNRQDEEGYAQVGAVARDASKTRHGRAQEEVRKRPW